LPTFRRNVLLACEKLRSDAEIPVRLSLVSLEHVSQLKVDMRRMGGGEGGKMTSRRIRNRGRVVTKEPVASDATRCI
jgi:xanthine dehydrogenase molybdopterin-binding subunit B